MNGEYGARAYANDHEGFKKDNNAVYLLHRGDAIGNMDASQIYAMCRVADDGWTNSMLARFVWHPCLHIDAVHNGRHHLFQRDIDSSCEYRFVSTSTKWYKFRRRGAGAYWLVCAMTIRLCLVMVLMTINLRLLPSALDHQFLFLYRFDR